MGIRKGPVIAIIGRPNVGKSTLFNKLTGMRKAIVQDLPGVTRDRNEGFCTYRDRQFTLIDTGGLLSDTSASFSEAIHRQSELAIEEADIVLFMMDAREGLTAEDHAVQLLLRKSGKLCYTIVNKTEGKGAERIDEFYELGADQLFAISSEHNIGLSDLLDELYPHLAPLEEASKEIIPKIVLIGRPNAGKSTLINTILKEERLLTSDIAGTTRDTIDTPVSRNGKDYIFIDTAGIRRRGKIEWGVEQYSISRAKGALKRSNVALLLLDSSEGITEQDTKIAGMVIEQGKGLILIVNKSDLFADDEERREQIEQQFGFRFSFVHDLPKIYVSALTGKGMTRLFKKIDEVFDAYTKRVPTGQLNRFFERVIQKHPPPSYKSKAINLFYITQVGTAPPSFVIFCNISAGVTDQYLRFVQNQLQETFQFWGVPVRVKVRARKRVQLQQLLNKKR